LNLDAQFVMLYCVSDTVDGEAVEQDLQKIDNDLRERIEQMLAEGVEQKSTEVVQRVSYTTQRTAQTTGFMGPEKGMSY